MLSSSSQRADFVGWLASVTIGAVFVVGLGTYGAIASGRWLVAALSIGPYLAFVAAQGATYWRHREVDLS